MRTLVIGSTGLVGFDVCRHLREARRSVRALVRPTADPQKRAELERLGVELVDGDLKDPTSLARACAGVQAVVSTATSTSHGQAGDDIETVDRQGQLSLVEAARAAGVEHVVFVSFRDDPRVDFPLGAAKRAVERALQASGMAYTILQASYFMEIWLSPRLGFDAPHGQVRVYGDGNAPISWISYRDVARAAADAVMRPEARNMVIELGGPEPLSPRDVVGLFEAAGAGPITVESVPVAALQAQLDASTDALQKSFAGLMLKYAGGDAIDAAASQRVLPFRRTPVREYVAAQLARG